MEKTTNWKSNNSNGHKLQICWKNGKERLFKNKCQVKSKMCRKPQLRIGKKTVHKIQMCLKQIEKEKIPIKKKLWFQITTQTWINPVKI